MRGITLTMLSLLVCLVATPTLSAQDSDAEVILRRCLDRIRSITERATGRNGDIAETAIARIEELLDEGKVIAARKVAQRAANNINTTTRNAIRTLNEECRRCKIALVRAEATPAQLRRLKQACDRADGAIKGSSDRARRAIRRALANGGGPGDE